MRYRIMKKSVAYLFVFVFMCPFLSCIHEAEIVVVPDRPDSEPVPREELYDEVFSDDVVHEFLIVMNGEEWNGITQDMLDYAKRYPITPYYQGDGRGYRTGNYREATMIYRRPGGEEIRLNGIGIRSRGNESRRLPYRFGSYRKSHFKLKFDETFRLEKGTDAYARRNKRRFAGMRALNFKWSRYGAYDRYADKTKIRELFSYELLRKAGVTAPRMSLATLAFVIDGKKIDYGIYGIVESIDKDFLRRRYGKNDNDGDLYKCLYLERGAHLTLGSIAGTNVGVKDWENDYRPIYDLKTNTGTSDHSAFRSFVKNINELEGDAFSAYIGEHFAADEFVRYLAMGIYINNLDDYRFLANNYYLYFHPDGKVRFIPYDFDISLGGGWHGEMNDAEFIHQDIFDTANLTEIWGERDRRPLVDKILATDEYRKRYVELLKADIDPANGLFLFSKYGEKFEKLSALYGGRIENDTMDPDPMGWQGFEEKYFHDKTVDVLDQLGLPHDGYELE
jgi:hypothetical protein